MRVLVVEDEVRLLKQLTNRIREALAKCIKAAYPHCDIVFCTGYSDYAPQAFEPVATFTKRSKELLAYLINKEGVLCPTSEICNAIFRDSSDSYLRVAKRDLKVILRDIGKADVLVSGWGVLGINRKEVRCDYYDYLDGKPGAFNLYRGVYMSQYDWARGKLSR